MNVNFMNEMSRARSQIKLSCCLGSDKSDTSTKLYHTHFLLFDIIQGLKHLPVNRH